MSYKTIFISILIILAVFVGSFYGLSKIFGKVPEKNIFAVINDRNYTLNDLFLYLEYTYPLLSESAMESDEIAEFYVDQFIRSRVIVQEAEKANLFNEQSVRVLLKTLMEPAALLNISKDTDMLPNRDAAFFRKLANDYIITNYINHIVQQNIFTDYERVREIYNEERLKYRQERQIIVSQIISLDKDKMENASQELEKYSFIEVQSKYSDIQPGESGEIIFTESTAPKQFLPLFNLSKNDVSDIFLADYGYAIFFIEEKYGEGQYPSLAKSLGTIQEAVYSLEAPRLAEEYINTLLNASNIKILEKNFNLKSLFLNNVDQGSKYLKDYVELNR